MMTLPVVTNTVNGNNFGDCADQINKVGRNDNTRRSVKSNTKDRLLRTAIQFSLRGLLWGIELLVRHRDGF